MTCREERDDAVQHSEGPAPSAGGQAGRYPQGHGSRPPGQQHDSSTLMAAREHSLGPLYAAWVPIAEEWCPPHTGGIRQMVAPWRRGRAFLFCPWGGRAVAIGLWIRHRAKVSED